MCVIAVSETVRLKTDQVEKMYEHNPAGGGVAWRDTIQEKGKNIKVVRWKKGLSKQEMIDLAKELPLPFVAHFRIPTVGGPKKALCHPFPIEADVALDLEGMTKGHVLFHNGHWGRWKESSLDAAIKYGLKVPTGKWSDSRAMAWAAALHGLGVLEFIDEKAIAFGPGPEDIQVFGGGQTHSSWTLIDSGIYVSNTSWQYTTTHYGAHHTTYGKGVCMFGTCKKDRTGGTKYCEDHPDGKEKVAGFLPAKKDDTTTGTSASDGVRGGSSNLTPFRVVQGSGSAVQTEPTQSEKVEEGSTGTRGVRTSSVGSQGEGEAGSETRKAVVSEQDAETFRWASGLNPKRYRASDSRKLVDPRVSTIN